MSDFDRSNSVTMSGTGLCPGISVGTAYRVEPRSAVLCQIRIARQEVSSELSRLREAVEESRRELQQVKLKFEAEVGKEHAYIIDAHLLILEDQQFLQEIEKRICEDLQSPERAVREAADKWVYFYRSLEDPFFQERGSDVEEVVERLVSNLVQLNPHSPHDLPEDLILVAPEVSLFLLSEYPLDQLKGLVLKKGGETSHVVIVARSCQIPVVSGIEAMEETIRTGDTLILDGVSGTVVVRPSESHIRSFQVQARTERERVQERVQDSSPCVTVDGRKITLYANAEIGSEVPEGMKLGAEGIGLFRSEYIYMLDKSQPVSEERQLEIYKTVAREVGDRPAIIRTLDLGDEGHPYFSRIAGGREPSMGLRGIRLSLRYPEIYKSQVRAILRANHRGNLKIVFPMVSGVDEVIQGRQLIREVQEELKQKGLYDGDDIEVGVMVELPAAVFLLKEISAHVNFLAVGSNDLIQYTLAAGRNNEQVAYLFNPLHPAVLKILFRVAEVAKESQVIALVCGEIASHPVYARLLVGMGFQYLSMNSFAIPDIKRVIRETSYLEARDTVDHLLSLVTLDETEAYINHHFKDRLGLPVDQLTN